MLGISTPRQSQLTDQVYPMSLQAFVSLAASFGTLSQGYSPPPKGWPGTHPNPR